MLSECAGGKQEAVESCCQNVLKLMHNPILYTSHCLEEKMPQQAFTALDFHLTSSHSAQANKFHALRSECKVKAMHSRLPKHRTREK